MAMRFGRFGVALAALVLAATAAQAADFKWANDGDARALDPYTFNETVQNSLLSNIYERLVQHNRKLELEPGLALSWENTEPNIWRFHLRPMSNFRMERRSPPTT